MRQYRKVIFISQTYQNMATYGNDTKAVQFIGHLKLSQTRNRQNWLGVCRKRFYSKASWKIFILLSKNSVKVTLFKCSLCTPLCLIVGEGFNSCFLKTTLGSTLLRLSFKRVQTKNAPLRWACRTPAPSKIGFFVILVNSFFLPTGSLHDFRKTCPKICGNCPFTEKAVK